MPLAFNTVTDLLEGDEFAHIFNSKYGAIDYEYGISSASTDFVSSVSIISLHACPHDEAMCTGKRDIR